MRWSWTAWLLVGCNQLWGLDKTQLINEDMDEDGVLDQLDVCPGVADPEQLDTDGDGLGDACDPCPRGSNHDEDGDGFLDGCDNCPQIANTDQKNDDGDDLGNRCDHDNATMQTRMLFDGFETLNSVDWVQVFIDWEAIDDAVSPKLDNLSTAGMWNLRQRVGGKSWYVEIGFTVANEDGRYGIMGYAPSTGDPEFACLLIRSSGNWSIMAKSAVKPLATAPTGVLTLRLRRDATMMHCELVGVDDAMTIDNLSDGTQPGFQTTAITKVFYVDAVSGP